MAHPASLVQARRFFAEELRVVCHLGSESVVEAFAAVPRERFAGKGPWRILHQGGDGYWSTPDAEPHWLYHNVLIALDEARRLNIGEPSLWAFHFDRVGVRRGERVLQLGAGSGYYTAILAELVGPTGRVDAMEIDEGLARLAQSNLAAWPTAHVRCADASRPIEGQWDLIVAFAGATGPLGWWLDALADGGRLLLPMTGANFRGGFMLRLDRRGKQLGARSVGWTAFYPCAGARDDREDAALAEALKDPAGQQALRNLRRDRHDKDDSCWLHGDGWCLSKRELH
jgi:protein-L-isoaspartate(D-aspartate) O-methyltransferase